MLNRIALCALLGTSMAWSQAIPDHPGKLSFKPISFQAPQAKDTRIKLKNGITAYLVPDPAGQPLVNIRILLKGGSYLEPAGKEGLAPLMAGQLRAGGTEKTPADKLDERLEFLSANLDAYMAPTQGAVQLNLMEKDMQEGLGILMEILTQPTFQQDRLDIAKKSMRQALERRNDDTESIEEYQLEYLLRGEKFFANRHPTAASLDAITREDLKALHTKLLHPRNLIVSVAGKFDRKAMIRLLNDTLGTLKAGPKAEASPKVPAPDFVRQPGIYVAQKEGTQGRVMLALPGLRRFDADWPAVVVMNHILGGGGFASRLVNRIRSDEGLSYSVFSTFTSGNFFQGDFLAGFQTKNRSVPFGIRIALTELAKMRDTLVSESEFQTAKGNIIDGFPTRFASKTAVSNLFADEEYCGAPEDFYAAYRGRIQAVTREDIQRVARKYLVPEKLVILAVGNVKEMEEGDVKDHPGKLSEVAKLPFVNVPLRDPLTMKPLK